MFSGGTAPKQMIGFYMKLNTGLKWVKKVSSINWKVIWPNR